MVIISRQQQLRNWKKTETNFSRMLICFKLVLSLYFTSKIVNFFNDKFMFFLVSNIIAFHGLIEQFCPDSLFKARISVKQIIEGVIGIIECLIPRYEDNEKK